MIVLFNVMLFEVIWFLFACSSQYLILIIISALQQAVSDTVFCVRIYLVYIIYALSGAYYMILFFVYIE